MRIRVIVDEILDKPPIDVAQGQLEYDQVISWVGGFVAGFARAQDVPREEFMAAMESAWETTASTDKMLRELMGKVN